MLFFNLLLLSQALIGADGAGRFVRQAFGLKVDLDCFRIKGQSITHGGI